MTVNCSGFVDEKSDIYDRCFCESEMLLIDINEIHALFHRNTHAPRLSTLVTWKQEPTYYLAFTVPDIALIAKGISWEIETLAVAHARSLGPIRAINISTCPIPQTFVRGFCATRNFVVQIWRTVHAGYATVRASVFASFRIVLLVIHA